MTTFDLVSTWVQLSPDERRSVRRAYFPPARIDRSLPDAYEFARPLSSALRHIAVALQESWATPATAGPVSHGSGRGAPAAPWSVPVDARWRWDTGCEQMTWTPGMFALYGYPTDAVDPTIWRHFEHKEPGDRARVEALVLSGAADDGPLRVRQQLFTTEGELRSVSVLVSREPGEREVLTGTVLEVAAG